MSSPIRLTGHTPIRARFDTTESAAATSENDLFDSTNIVGSVGAGETIDPMTPFVTAYNVTIILGAGASGLAWAELDFEDPAAPGVFIPIDRAQISTADGVARMQSPAGIEIQGPASGKIVLRIDNTSGGDDLIVMAEVTGQGVVI